jgi:hypothetical protein
LRSCPAAQLFCSWSEGSRRLASTRRWALRPPVYAALLPLSRALSVSPCSTTGLRPPLRSFCQFVVHANSSAPLHRWWVGGLLPAFAVCLGLDSLYSCHPVVLMGKRPPFTEVSAL